MGRTGFAPREMDRALERLARGVERLGDWLLQNGGPWLMGAQLTLADIAAMPVLVRMDDLNLHGAWSGHPQVERWLERMRAQPAFAPTYYPGSLLTEKYPHLATLREQRAARKS